MLPCLAGPWLQVNGRRQRQHWRAAMRAVVGCTRTRLCRNRALSSTAAWAHGQSDRLRAAPSAPSAQLPPPPPAARRLRRRQQLIQCWKFQSTCCRPSAQQSGKAWTRRQAAAGAGGAAPAPPPGAQEAGAVRPRQLCSDQQRVYNLHTSLKRRAQSRVPLSALGQRPVGGRCFAAIHWACPKLSGGFEHTSAKRGERTTRKASSAPRAACLAVPAACKQCAQHGQRPDGSRQRPRRS